MYIRKNHPILAVPITMYELIRSLKKTKNGKAPGSDGMSNEFLKQLPGKWLLYVLSVFNRIFESGILLVAWTNMISCMMLKK